MDYASESIFWRSGEWARATAIVLVDCENKKAEVQERERFQFFGGKSTRFQSDGIPK